MCGMGRKKERVIGRVLSLSHNKYTHSQCNPDAPPRRRRNVRIADDASAILDYRSFCFSRHSLAMGATSPAVFWLGSWDTVRERRAMNAMTTILLLMLNPLNTLARLDRPDHT